LPRRVDAECSWPEVEFQVAGRPLGDDEDARGSHISVLSLFEFGPPFVDHLPHRRERPGHRAARLMLKDPDVGWIKMSAAWL
jgi:hypothetical protein